MPGDPRRDARVRQVLTAHGLAALICRLPDNLVCLADYYPQVGLSFIVYPAEGDPTLIVPRPERDLATAGLVSDVRVFETWRLIDPPPMESIGRLLEQVIAEKKLAGKPVGYEGSFEAVSPSQMSAEPYVFARPTKDLLGQLIGDSLIDATEALNEIRAVKLPREIAKLRLANEVAGIGLRVFKEQVQPGRTEAQVAAAVEAAIYASVGYKGVRSARAWAQVFSGPNTIEGWYYPVSSNRVIEPNDTVMIELGTVVDGYWSDLTRTVAAGGRADSRVRELYHLVERAQRAALLAARPGVTGREVDAAARAVFAEVDLVDCFQHHTGHGLGFRYHEPIPSVHPASAHVLEVGHVHSIEPGLYAPEFGGVRIEDDAVVLENGAEFLSTRDFGLE